MSLTNIYHASTDATLVSGTSGYEAALRLKYWDGVIIAQWALLPA
jgi:hypothetical protein